jgi:hypothetical protein
MKGNRKRNEEREGEHKEYDNGKEEKKGTIKGVRKIIMEISQKEGNMNEKRKIKAK